MRTVLLTFCLIIPFSAIAQDKFEPRQGAAKDDSGDIRWTSSADKAGKDEVWTYLRQVTNLDEERRCFTKWTIGKNECTSLIPKKTTHTFCKLTIGLGPAEHAGTIYYNGGEKPGEKSKDAPALNPKGTLTGSLKDIKNETDVGFMLGDTFYSGQVLTEFKCTEKSPYAVWLNITFNFPVPNSVRIRWNTILVDDLLRQDKGTLVDPKSKLLSVVRTDKLLRADAKFTSIEPPIFVEGTLDFLNYQGERIASTYAPALLPNNTRPPSSKEGKE